MTTLRALPAGTGLSGELPDTWRQVKIESARRLVDEFAGIEPELLTGPLAWLWCGRLLATVHHLLDILDSQVPSP